jgi:DNA-binding transcriptional regulator YiaG
MPQFSSLFQAEVRRLARKELKSEIAQVRKQNTILRRQLVSLKRDLAQALAAQKRIARKDSAPTPAAEEATSATRQRISSKTIRTLRARLGLTQVEFAKLVGVSGQAVYQWERGEGRLRLRHATRQAIADIKNIGAREARRRLETRRK